MTTRRGWAGVAAVLLAAAGASAQKPAGLPQNPLVEGREPTPLAREFHLPDAPPRPTESIPWPVPPKSMAELIDAAMSLVTFQLGLAPVGK